MKARRRSREIALQFLYRNDLVSHLGKTESVPNASLVVKGPIDFRPEFINHLNHFQVAPELREYSTFLALGTLNHLQVLDSVLVQHVENWKLSRLSYVDRNLLRLATFELLFERETPASVVLDETIELGKQFGTTESSAFINGILDSVKTKLNL